MGRINKRTQQSRTAGRLGGRPKKAESIPEIGNSLVGIGEEGMAEEPEIQALGKYPSYLLTFNPIWSPS